MAEQEFNIIPSNQLPEAIESEIANGKILIITSDRVKQAPSIKMKGEKGDSAYLRNTGTYIQWKLGVTGAWENLVSIADITGPKGEKPVFRTSSVGIEYKYENEADTAYRLLVSFDTLKLKFTDLTAEQKDELTLHYEDLTPEQIIELQKPASDAAKIITELGESLSIAEQGRVTAENVRQENEDTRKSNETARKSAETKRNNKETERIASEEARTTAEQSRSESESSRVIAEQKREEQEETRQENTSTALQNAGAATDRLNALSDHRDYVDDTTGNWMHWNEETGEYEDTGVKGRGDIMYATFEVDTETGQLIMNLPNGYNGPSFALEEGNLMVIINE